MVIDSRTKAKYILDHTHNFASDAFKFYLMDVTLPSIVKARIDSTAYKIGDCYIPATPNGHFYYCCLDGTSDAAPPTFTTDGTAFADGTAVFQDWGTDVFTLGFADRQNSTAYLLGEFYFDVTGSNIYFCTQAGTTDVSEPAGLPADNGIRGQEHVDGTAKFTHYYAGNPNFVKARPKITSAYEDWADISSYELATGNGYTNGGITISVQALSEKNGIFYYPILNDKIVLTATGAIDTPGATIVNTTNGKILYFDIYKGDLTASQIPVGGEATWSLSVAGMVSSF